MRVLSNIYSVCILRGNLFYFRLALAAAYEILSKQPHVESKATETNPAELETELHSLRSSREEAEQKVEYFKRELEAERRHSRSVYYGLNEN